MYSHHSMFRLNLSLVSSSFWSFCPEQFLRNQHKLMKRIKLSCTWKDVSRSCVRSAVIHYSKLNVGYWHCALLKLLSRTFFLSHCPRTVISENISRNRMTAILRGEIVRSQQSATCWKISPTTLSLHQFFDLLTRGHFVCSKKQQNMK